MTVDIRIGDCRDVLKTLPDQSVHCIVTSPPYFGLRDYGVDSQIGLEQTPAAFVAELVAVFAEASRVLRDDGTLWLNLGDTYAGGGNGGGGSFAADRENWRVVPPRSGQRQSVDGLKAKDLIGIPWRVAFALQADGWYLRQDIIWHKPNPMPESVQDRCTKAHEYVFLLSKSPTYSFDPYAMQEPALRPEGAGNKTHKGATAYAEGDDKMRTKVGLTEIGARETRNKRSVWTVPTQPYSEAHFATFPPALIEPCVAAGCPVGGTVLDPFGGAGTTGLVADRLGRNAVLIELNPAYADLARNRIQDDAGMFGEVA